MILFVCTGNTCRSPMAEALYKSITGKDAISAGLSAVNGSRASEHSITVMAKRGIDIKEHLSRQIDISMLEEASAVLTMTEGHKAMLLYAGPEFSVKVFTIYEWAGKKGDVADPYGGSIEVYEECAKELEELIREGEKLH